MRVTVIVVALSSFMLFGCKAEEAKEGANKTAEKAAETPKEDHKLPEDPCERMYACGIDKSCGGSLFGEGPSDYKPCAKGEDCGSIVSCVEEKYSAVLTKAADKKLSDADGFLENCGYVMSSAGPLPKSEAIRSACESLFAAVEEKAAGTEDEVMRKYACKKGLQVAGQYLGGEYPERHRKLCSE